MADVARLGLAIDSRPVTTATAELNKLAPAAKNAQAAVSGLEKAAQPAADALARMQRQATTAATTGAANLTKQTGLARHELVNFSRQVQDVGVSLVSGQSPFMVLAQQGTQIADIFANSTGTLRGFAGQLLSVITPARALTVGIVALGAAAYAAYSNWKTFALGLDDIAHITGQTTREMAKLQAVASFEGISNDEFVKGMERFSAQVYQAQRGMGQLGDLFRANGIHAKTTAEALEGVAELIRRASSDQQRLVVLQRAGLPATMEWVRMLSGGAEGLRRAKASAVEFGGEVNDRLVKAARDFDREWNKAITNFTMQFKQAVVTVMEAFQDFNAFLERTGINTLIRNFAPMAAAARALGFGPQESAGGNGGSAPLKVTVNKTPLPATGSGIVDPAAAAAALQREQQRISLLGQLATVQDAIRLKEIEINQAALNGVGIRRDQAEALKRLAGFQAESAKLQQQVQFGIFDTGRQAASAQVELQTLIDQGVIQNAQQYAEAQAVIAKRIRESADQAEVARSKFEGLTRFAQDGSNLTKQLDQGAVSMLGNIESGLVAFTSGAQSAKDAFSNMARSILADLQRILIRMLITAPIARALGGMFGGGGGGGFLGGLFGGGGMNTGAPMSILPPLYHSGHGPGDPIKEVRFVHPAYFENAPRFHNGVGPGERAAVIRDDESVLTPGQMRALGGMTRGGAPSVQIVNNNTFNNADPGSEARIKTYIDQKSERTKFEAVQEVQKLYRNSPGARPH